MNCVKKRLCILTPLPDLGQLASLGGEAVFSAVAGSSLKGRGGEGFPVSEKWRLLAESKGEKELVALLSGARAAALMQENPEAVYAGTALAARAFGIKSAWLAHDAELGGFPEEYMGVAFRPVFIGRTLSSGEETRVFAAIDGGLPLSRTQPPYPTEKGVFGRPTLIHSAELLAHIPYLLAGCDADTALVSVSGAVRASGVYEVPAGAPISDILSGALCGELKGVQVGGENGAFLNREKLGTPFDCRALEAAGAFMGDGSLRALPSGTCVARALCTALRAAYPASCGKCVFCREGLYQLYLLVRDLTAGRASDEDLALIRDIAQVTAEAAACGHGRRSARMVLSALDGFAEEMVQHARRRCPELACPGMFTVHILGEKCSGCGACLKRCPAGAVAGGAGLIHVIDQQQCTQCMECLPCPADAIVRAGLLKPAGPERPVLVGSFAPKKKGLQKRMQ